MDIRETLDNYCDTSTLWEVYDEIKDTLGSEELLLALSKAMGADKLQDLLKYIARVYDL